MSSNGLDEIKNMSGGSFLNYLFGSDCKKTLNATELIMKALTNPDTKIVDFLLEQKFVPDMNITDENKRNILHLLTINFRKSPIIRRALINLIKNEKDSLNTKDKLGNTPVHYACEMDLPRVVEYMYSKGAKKIANNNDMIVVSVISEYDSSSDSDNKSFTFNLSETLERQSKPLTIIEKQPIMLMNNSLGNQDNIIKAIGDIVNSFDTTQTDEYSQISDTDKHTNKMINRVFSEISATDRPEIYNVNKDIHRPVRMELPEFLSQISDTDKHTEKMLDKVFSEISATDRPQIYNVNKDIHERS